MSDTFIIPVTESLLGTAEVRRRLDVSRPTLTRMCTKGIFPAPIKLQIGSIRWLESEVTAWIAAQASGPRVAYKLNQ